MNGIHAFNKLANMSEQERSECQFIMLTDPVKIDYMITEISDEYKLDFQHDFSTDENKLDDAEHKLTDIEKSIHNVMKNLLDNAVDGITDDTYNSLLDEFEGTLYAEIIKHFKLEMKKQGYSLLGE